jgi:hypothetical protein
MGPWMLRKRESSKLEIDFSLNLKVRTKLHALKTNAT